MADIAPGAPQAGSAPNDRLDTWKEIAAYLNRDVTTVQRWEKRERMPVHRHLHDRMGSVYASRAELDAWARSRNPSPAPDAEAPLAATHPTPTAPAPRFRRLYLFPVAVMILAALLWMRHVEFLWSSPIADARAQLLTGFDGGEQAAATSRDGRFVAFLSDRDGPMDVWVTQIGSGDFHNLTRGAATDIVNTDLRTLGFTPDGALVTFWQRRRSASGQNIGVWAAPVLGGAPRPYLDGAAELAFAPDSSRVAYHTTDAGDPMFVSDGIRRSTDRPILTAPAGSHDHFQTWSPDGAFLYFVRGEFPARLDIWRIPSGGGTADQITSHKGRVTHPVFIDSRTLLYLATDADGSGPWLYSIDTARRVPHRLDSGPDPYSALAASQDGRRLVATRSTRRQTLWRLRLPLVSEPSAEPAAPEQILLKTGSGSMPSLGSDYLIYVSATGSGQSLWKIAGNSVAELWNGVGAEILGAAVSPDRQSIAFAASQRRLTTLYVMQADGANARVVTDSLRLRGAPAWSADGQSLAVAADDQGAPHLYRLPLNGGRPEPLAADYSLNPAWSPDGRFVLYSGQDIGTVFSLKAVTPAGAPYTIPALTLTRGARRVRFLEGGRALAFLQGEMHHLNLWRLDLDSGATRQLTDVPHDFEVSDFDISPDGSQVILQREQSRSDIVTLDLPSRRWWMGLF